VALGLLSMVALIMTIYTFYLMFFTENEAWAKKAKWNLVGIFIALAIIGLSWLIVSFIFRWYQEQWQKRNEEIEKWNITMINYEMDSNLDNQIYLTV
jgi:RsiW-degrading membrane proteinase PrsW (M82 family)